MLVNMHTCSSAVPAGDVGELSSVDNAQSVIKSTMSVSSSSVLASHQETLSLCIN
jgi:hypothetical protein